MRKLETKRFTISPNDPLLVLCGPCVIEGEEFLMNAAQTLKTIYEEAGVQLVFKASYDKANRSSSSSFRGPGVQEGLRMLQKVKDEFDLPIVTDVHTPEEAIAAAEVCDILQIPAFLSRQTDLILAAAKTGCVVEVKKGQFMSPWEMQNVIHKVESCGNKNILLVDRGTTFGYQNLIVDMRSIPLMQEFGYPVGLDATHAVQIPGGAGNASSGERRFIPTLAKAAIGCGVDFLFMEAHPDPKNAKSDRDTVLPFTVLPSLLRSLKRLREASLECESVCV